MAYVDESALVGLPNHFDCKLVVAWTLIEPYKSNVIVDANWLMLGSIPTTRPAIARPVAAVVGSDLVVQRNAHLGFASIPKCINGVAIGILKPHVKAINHRQAQVFRRGAEVLRSETVDSDRRNDDYSPAESRYVAQTR